MTARLHEIFDPYINLADYATKPAAEREKAFLSRAYVALYFLDKLSLSPEEAANCITDGYEDDGIDAVFVDKTNSRLYFAQSKWHSNMAKGVKLTDFTRFRDGVKNILTLKWNKNNRNLHRFRNDIEYQLKNINTELRLIFAHTSENEISENIYEYINLFLAENNTYYSDFLTFSEYGIKDAAQSARSYTRPENINLSVMLGHWGIINGPYKSVYGSVAASDLVSWFREHNNKLFAENLRYGIEKSDVNEGIILTASKDPDSFWYFNNGVTAICDSLAKQPIGGNDTSSGVFDVKKISVINGAQTISSLAKANAAGADISKIKVHLRIISLLDTPEGFAASVTSANNTQNDLNPVDFVASDPNQERIRKEAVQRGLLYTFRRGDKDPEKGKGFTIRTATIAAACASGDLKLAVSSKRYISGLWENTKRDPYTRLFNDKTTADYLWSAVRVMNAVDEELVALSQEHTGRDRLVAVHGNRFILFCVFNLIDLNNIKYTQSDEEISNLCAEITRTITSSLIEIISNKFPEAYPGNIFKNQERQSELVAALGEAVSLNQSKEPKLNKPMQAMLV
ncbi:AIPR family protein [Brucella sp. IR073]|uniref:AIPR family protein n=1 Tax=unclassified Brucella TaxID=2632610 RepID=UPI003B987896